MACWQVAKQNGAVPNLYEVSENCLLVSWDLSRTIQMMELANGVISGIGRKIEGGLVRNYQSSILQV